MSSGHEGILLMLNLFQETCRCQKNPMIKWGKKETYTMELQKWDIFLSSLSVSSIIPDCVLKVAVIFKK